MSIEPSIPLPLEPTPPPEADQRRLWIGNIDNRLTEYNLLKIVQKFGQIKNFDFLFHKSGALKGQPRGYSFVTFETRKQAETALAALNGKTILGKTLAAKWAHTIPSEISPSQQQKSAASAAAKGVEDAKQTKNTIHQIMEIEAKLTAMEEQKEKELEMCLSSVPVSEHNPLLTRRRVQHKHRPYHRRK